MSISDANTNASEGSHIVNFGLLLQEVPVLPVLAKADCMTAGELASFREYVRNTLHHVRSFPSPLTTEAIALQQFSIVCKIFLLFPSHHTRVKADEWAATFVSRLHTLLDDRTSLSETRLKHA